MSVVKMKLSTNRWLTAILAIALVLTILLMGAPLLTLPKVNAAEVGRAFPMVAAEFYRPIVLKSDGTVWYWVANIHGDQGYSSTNRYSLVQVSGLSNIIAIANGSIRSLALKSDGTVWSWGKNNNGQLGDGTNSNRNTPVRVTRFSNIVSIAVGSTQSLALRSDGTILAMGAQVEGEVANIGPMPSKFRPELALTVSPASGQTYANDITLTVTLTGSAHSNAGKVVRFTSEGIPSDTTVITNAGGVATLVIYSSDIGDNTFKASFAGDIYNEASTDAIASYTISKGIPQINVLPIAGNIYKGEALSSSVLTGGVTSISGTFTWTDSNQIPVSSDSFLVTFTPNDNAKYETISLSVPVAVIDKVALEAFISLANDTLNAAVVGDGNGQHTQNSVSELAVAITIARNTAANKANTQAVLNTAVSDLQSAITAFNNSKVAVGFATIDIAIADAKAIEKSNYTDGSWNALQDAIASAGVLRNKANVTQAEIDTAMRAIMDAQSALEEKAVKESGSMSWLWISLAAVAIIAVAGVALFIIRRKRTA